MLFTFVFDLAFLAVSFHLIFRVTSNIRWMALAILSSVGTLLNAILLPHSAAAVIVVVGMFLLAVVCFRNYREAANS